MFAKSKVSQSMIDAVNKVLGEQPTQTAQPVQPTEVKEELLKEGWDDMVKDAKEKVKSGPKPSGGAGKKEGSRYGGSKQKDEKEPVKEELKGNQTKIDANHNGKIDGQDFAILRGKKKKMREHLNDMPFAKKLIEKELDEGLMKKAFKALTGGSDKDHLDRLKKSMYGKDSEVKYAAKTLVKHAKDPLGLKKEEVEQIDELSKSTLSSYLDKKKSEYMKGKTQSGSKENAKDIQNMGKAYDKLKKEDIELTEEQLDEMINEVLSKNASAGDWIHDFVHSKNPKFAGKSTAERKKMALGAYYGKQNEEANATTDSLCGRYDGSDENTFTHFKKKLKGDIEPDLKDNNNPEETAARKTVQAKPTNTLAKQVVDNVDK